MKARRYPGGQARHADDWLMTYADTITLLLCLFAVLLAFRGTKRWWAWRCAWMLN
jgi:flagellar motor protein MotB